MHGSGGCNKVGSKIGSVDDKDWLSLLLLIQLGLLLFGLKQRALSA